MSKQEQIYHSSMFKHYINRKKRFVLLLTSFFCFYYFSLPLLTSFFPKLTNMNILNDVTFVWFFALSQIIVTWSICHLYSYKANFFDQTAQNIIKSFRD